MIVWLQETNTVRVLSLQDNGTISILGVPVLLIFHQTGYRITSHKDLYFESTDNPYGKRVSFVRRYDDSHGMMIIDEGNPDYQCYERRNSFQAGTGNSLDLIFPQSGSYMAVEGNTFQAPTYALMKPALNGTCLNEGNLKDGDILSFYPFIICFEKDFLLIHTGKGKVNLKSWIPKVGVCKQLPQLQLQHGVQIHFEPHYAITLPEPGHLPLQNTEGRFLRSLPSIMMALASLSVALINAYNVYDSGGDVKRMVPMLVIPVTMLLSAILINPLIHYFEKRSHTKKVRAEEKRYASILDDVKKQIRTHAVNYECSVKAFLSEETCVIQSLHTAWVVFDACDNVLSYDITKRSHTEMQEIEEMANAFMIQRFDTKAHYTVNLFDYTTISICGSKAMDVLRYVCTMLTRHSPVKMAFLTNEEELPWVRNIAGVYENGRRNIFKDEESVQRFLDSHTKCIVIALRQTTLKNKVGQPVITVSTEQVMSDTDLFIQAEECMTVHDYTNHKDLCIPYGQLYEETMRDDSVFHPLPGLTAGMDNDFLSVHELVDVNASEIETFYENHCVDDDLTALIGKDMDGNVISLNLHETGHGPHGIVAGMTGSGKSELLLSLVLSLALRYSPSQVQFAFVDFKGGGLASQLSGLPHTCGILSNLDESGFKKALCSFKRICLEREQFIHTANQRCDLPISNLIAYRRNHHLYKDLPYPADLVIIIDEFAELKKTCPEYMSELISIARIGRSLGIHLILCTQKPAGNINEEILSNCSFRIVLKVSDSKDSYEVIRRNDAALFTSPGEMLVELSGTVIRGSAAYVNARTPMDGYEVHTLHPDGTILHNSHDYVPLHAPQLLCVRDAIKKASDFKAEPLWTESLSQNEFDSKDHTVFSIRDDIEQNSHIPMTFDKRWLFATKDEEEKSELVKSLISLSLNEERNIVITGLNDELKEQLKGYPCISIIDDNETERALQMMSKEKERKMIWICADIPYRKNDDFEKKMLMERVLEHAGKSDMQVAVITDDVSLLSLRMQKLFEYTVILHETDRNEVRAVLNVRSEKITDEAYCGLICVDGSVQEWCYRKTDDSTLLQALYNSTHITHFHTGLPEYTGDDIPIGYGESGWLCVHTYPKLIIASDYDDTLYEFEQKYRRKAHIMYGIDEEKDGIYLLDERSAERYKYRIPIVLMESQGPYGNFKVKKKISDHEALLLYDRHSEVIRLVC